MNFMVENAGPRTKDVGSWVETHHLRPARFRVRLQYPDIRQIPVLLGVVEAVPHDKMVVDREPEIIDGDALVVRYFLFQERADLHGTRLPGREDLNDLLERPPGVDDVLDDDDVPASDVGGEVPQKPNVPRGFGARPV